jgi:hypothetical protein
MPPRRVWTPEEDDRLKTLHEAHGTDWSAIAGQFEDRTPGQIESRWTKLLNPDLHKGPFCHQEDDLIRTWVEEHGTTLWHRITTVVPQRSPKQCRERWYNHLSPDVIKTEWTPQEDDLLLRHYLETGGKWAKIANFFPGRSDNALKNRWNSSVLKRLKLNEDGQPFVGPDSAKRKPRVIPGMVLQPARPPDSAAGRPPPNLVLPIIGGRPGHGAPDCLEGQGPNPGIAESVETNA